MTPAPRPPSAGRAALVAALVLFGAPAAVAHVPSLGAGGADAADATTLVADDVSRVVYGRTAPGASAWFVLSGPAEVTLLAPVRGPAPRLFVHGDDVLRSAEELPGEPEYEAFAPSSFRTLARADAPRGALLEVRGGPQAADFALVTGTAEAFTAGEWLGTAFLLPRIWGWSGTPAALPVLAWLAAAAVVVLAARARDLVAFAGAVTLGGAAAVASVAAWHASLAPPGAAVVPTLVVIGVQAAAGSALVASSRLRSGLGRTAGTLAAAAVAAAAWSPLLIGPVLAALGTFEPSRARSVRAPALPRA